MDCTACWMPRHADQDGDDALSGLLRSLTAERVVAAAARIGARSVAAIDLAQTPASLDEAAEGFAHVCDLAAEHGLLAHIEFLPVGGIRSLAQTWDIVQAAGRPNGGITLDSWHFFRSGSTLDQLAAIPGHRIHTVQLSDAPRAAQADLWAELMTARLLPGEGDIDLTGLIRTLDAIGCTAPVGVEVFNIRQDAQTPTQIARDWSAAARTVLSKARGNP
jgi:sugar phosphate isomerase/epimerase